MREQGVSHWRETGTELESQSMEEDSHLVKAGRNGGRQSVIPGRKEWREAVNQPREAGIERVSQQRESRMEGIENGGRHLVK